MDNDTLIFSYSRTDALADGVLVDVTEAAKEAGFRYPVAMTGTLFAELEHCRGHVGESLEGRLWDVFMMLRFAISRQKGHEPTLLFNVIIGFQTHVLKSVIGPGDDLAPVLTIMFDHED